MKTTIDTQKQKKIIAQIYRLCEKQYRKGFQHGFYACAEKGMTKDRVDKFRSDGDEQNYSKMVNPLLGYSYLPQHKIPPEMAMPNMEELINLINYRL